MEDKGIDSFADAVAAAEAEVSGDAEAVEEAPSTPLNDADPFADDADVEPTQDPQSTPADEEVDEFDFDFEATDESDSDSDQVPSVVTIEGFGDLTPEEIRSGLLMQADYTKKTQELSNAKAQLEQERQAFAQQQSSQNELWKSLQDSPKETVAWLATQVGLIEPGEAKTKLNEIGDIRMADAAAVEAEVQARLDQAVQQHPAVRDAIRQKVVSQIDAQFDQIAGRVGKPLSEGAKQKLMDFAYENGIADLVVAYDALSARASEQSKKRSTAPQSRKAQNSQQAAKPAEVDSFDDAVNAAYAELEALGVVS